MADEQPVVEQPVMEATPEVSAEDKMKSLIETLDKLNIDSPAGLEGMATASQQAGNLSNLLGDERKRADALEAELTRLRTAPKPQQQEDYGYGNEVDLGQMVSKTVRSELQQFADNMGREQMKQQEAYTRETQAIMGDEDYPMVEEMFTKHMNNPNVTANLNAGLTTRTAEYNKLVRTVYRQTLLQTKDALKDMTGTKTPVIPHMESSESHTTPMSTETTKVTKEVKNIVDKDKGFKGTDEDIQDLVRAFNKSKEKENPDFFKTW